MTTPSGPLRKSAARLSAAVQQPVSRGSGFLVVAGTLALVLVSAAVVLWRSRPIRIGVMHSLTGTMSFSERPLVDAVLMAVDEVNARGGLLGRQVEAIVVDGKSDPDVFAREAERLISTEHVEAVFGCWTSSCRRTVRPVFERFDNVLFYPVQYEGLEESPNIVYVGAAPNQQIIPALKWAMGNLGKRLFLVGSDYVFPRAANAMIKDYVRRWRGQVVGEEYLLLGSTDVAAAVRKIREARPDAILNTLNGDSNLAFFRALRAAGITPLTIPTVSFSIAEVELQLLDPKLLAGDYAAWNYFQSIDNDVNTDFVSRFRDRYGAARVVDDPIEASYIAVHLWANAVTAAGTARPHAVRQAVKDRSFRAPEGMVYVDAETNHTWKTVRIARARADGGFDVLWTSDQPIRPVPYPETRSRAQWSAFLDDLYLRWGKQWANPGATPARTPGGT